MFITLYTSKRCAPAERDNIPLLAERDDSEGLGPLNILLLWSNSFYTIDCSLFEAKALTS